MVKANGFVVRNPYFTLLVSRVPDHDSSRIGIVVGRRVGKAVRRNRLKRIFRELVRESYSGMSLGYHCIVYPKAKVLEVKYQEVGKAWNGTLAQVGLLQT